MQYPICDAAVTLIQESESLALTAELCPAGVWTIGWGHTQGVRQGDVITRADAERLLAKDLRDYADAVRRLTKVGLSDNELGALTSFTMNLGAGALAGSTLLRKLNAGDRQGAADEFRRWVWATHRGTGAKLKLPGLETRRKREADLFLGVAA